MIFGWHRWMAGAATAVDEAVRRRRRPGVAAVAALAATAVMAGCDPAISTSARAGEPPIGPVSVLASDAEIVLPLDAYLLTEREQYLVNKATNALGRGCLKQFGLSWPVTPPHIGGESSRNSRRYGVSDAKAVGADGYRPVDALARHRKIAAQEAALARPSNDAVTAWYGNASTLHGKPVPVGGCAAEAGRRLAEGSAPPDVDIAQRLQLQSFELAKKDSRTKAVFNSWHTCMAERGYSYDDPFAAADDRRWREPKISAVEIAVAKADVACKQEVNLIGVMFAVETAYQRLSVGARATELKALRSYLHTQLDNAQRSPSS